MAIIKILAITKANLFFLNIFGINFITICQILNQHSLKKIFFQKNFKFRIHIQRKNRLNLIPSPNKIPKTKGGKKYINKFEIKKHSANVPLSKIFFF